MTVKEFCEKYEISLQAVYQKIKSKRKQLDGHITKKGCLQIDSFAEELLKPRHATSDIFSEYKNTKSELRRTNNKFEILQNELSDKKSEIEKMKNLLDEKNAKIEDLENQLTLKNAEIENEKNIEKCLSENIAEKNTLIEELRSTIADLTEQLREKEENTKRGLFKRFG